MKLDPQALKRSPVFAALPDGERRGIAAAATLRQLAPGKALFIDGEAADNVFLTLSGHIKLSRASWHRGSIILGIAHPGEPFGWVQEPQRERYAATATALCHCALAVWPGEVWNGFVRDMPGLAINLVRFLHHQQALMQDRLMEVASLDVPRRLAHVVLRLADQAGRRTDEGVAIDFPVTREDLAALACTTLHSASRILTRWRRLGLIGGRRRALVVRDIPALIGIATAIFPES